MRTRAAIVAAAGEWWDEAETLFGEALKGAEAMANRLEQADIRRFHARMLLDRGVQGDKERAGDLLDEAARRYREIGMPKFEELWEQMR